MEGLSNLLLIVNSSPLDVYDKPSVFTAVKYFDSSVKSSLNEDPNAVSPEQVAVNGSQVA